MSSRAASLCVRGRASGRGRAPQPSPAGRPILRQLEPARWRGELELFGNGIGRRRAGLSLDAEGPRAAETGRRQRRTPSLGCKGSSWPRACLSPGGVESERQKDLEPGVPGERSEADPGEGRGWWRRGPQRDQEGRRRGLPTAAPPPAPWPPGQTRPRSELKWEGRGAAELRQRKLGNGSTVRIIF